MKKYILSILVCGIASGLSAQEIPMTETASLEQVCGEAIESYELLPFNDLNIEFGYVLYQAEIEIESEQSGLELENVRDYAVIYLNNNLQGTITDNNKKLELNVPPGRYTLRLYAENIGRITYGPEILDNSKGLFGSIVLNDAEIENWTIIPLLIKESDVENLQFDIGKEDQLPSFHRGSFKIESPEDMYLDCSGWGMGEVWVNGNYMGSYWEKEKQQSIQVSAGNLLKGKNEIVVFELKNNTPKSMKLSQEPVFK